MDEHVLETFRRLIRMAKNMQDEINQILEGLPTVTQHIVSVERGETRNSASPMWRCVTSTGERVNVFRHEDPDKNNFALFETAGYGGDLLSMQIGDTREWSHHPIEVSMRKPGKFWEIVAVGPKPDGSAPDQIDRVTGDLSANTQALDNLRGAMDDLPF